MRMHTEKTKVMTIGKYEIHIQIELNGRTLEVAIYKYLEICIHKDGKEEAELKMQQSYSMHLSRFIRKNEKAKKTKFVVYNTVVKPISTYGCKGWVLM